MNPLHWLARPELTALAAALLHFLWQGTLIALLLAAAVRLLAIRRAGHRYACSLAALAAMSLCPIVTLLVMGRQRSEPPLAAADEELSAPAAVTLASDGLPLATDPLWQRLPVLTRQAQPYLLALWLAGVCVFGLRLMFGLVGVARLARQKLPLPLDLAGRVEQLGKALCIDALRRVFLSRSVREALVVGFWRPLVLVPAAWASEMPPVVLEAIIAHELAHIRRWDLCVNLLQRVMETLLFYHPAVWWVSRQLRLEREMCCDELAVAATGRRVEYAETLELVARERLAGVRPALAAGIRGESNMKLLARVRNVLGSPADQASGLWPAGVLALLLPLGLWAVTWGVLSPSPSAAIAADDDDGDDREDRDDDDDDRRPAGKDREDDDDDDKGEARKEGDRDRKEGEARDKKELLREFLERKEGGRERKEGDAPRKEEERKEGDAPRKERKEGDAPKKERKEGDEPKKVRKEGDQPKKVIKEGGQPKKVIKEREGERKESIKKEVFRKEGEAPVKKPPLKDGGEKGGDFAELAALVKELRGEVDRLRAEVRELRGGKPGREEGAEKLPRIKAEAAIKQKLLEGARDKERAVEREAVERKEREAKEREAIEQKLRDAAGEKARAAEREAVERKEREVKEREAARDKERAFDREAAERKERELKERKATERRKDDDRAR